MSASPRILFCSGCKGSIARNEIEDGLALRLGTEFVCPGCLAELKEEEASETRREKENQPSLRWTMFGTVIGVLGMLVVLTGWHAGWQAKRCLPFTLSAGAYLTRPLTCVEHQREQARHELKEVFSRAFTGESTESLDLEVTGEVRGINGAQLGFLLMILGVLIGPISFFLLRPSLRSTWSHTAWATPLTLLVIATTHLLHDDPALSSEDRPPTAFLDNLPGDSPPLLEDLPPAVRSEEPSTPTRIDEGEEDDLPTPDFPSEVRVRTGESVTLSGIRVTPLTVEHRPVVGTTSVPRDAGGYFVTTESYLVLACRIENVTTGQVFEPVTFESLRRCSVEDNFGNIMGPVVQGLFEEDSYRLKDQRLDSLKPGETLETRIVAKAPVLDNATRFTWKLRFKQSSRDWIGTFDEGQRIYLDFEPGDIREVSRDSLCAGLWDELHLPPRGAYDHPYQLEEKAPDPFTNAQILQLGIREPSPGIDALYFFAAVSPAECNPPPPTVSVQVLATSPDLEFIESRALSFLVDGAGMQFGDGEYDWSVESGYVLESLDWQLPLEDFLKLVRASSAKMRAGGVDHALTASQLTALRDFASRLRR